MTSLTQRLDEIDALKASGRLSEAEYAQARSAILAAASGPSMVVAAAQAARHKCPRGHVMTFGQRMMRATKHGQHPVEQVACGSCYFQLPKDEQYFLCHTCQIPYCETCVATNNVRPVAGTPWHSGLYDCCQDGGSCADAFVWWPCFQSHLQCFGGLQDGKAADEGTCCRDICCTFLMGMSEPFAAFGFSSCMFAPFYMRLQVVFNIEPQEDCGTVCCKHYFCRCCLLSQVYREMKARGVDPGGFCCTSRPPIMHRPPRARVMGGSADAAEEVVGAPVSQFGYSSAPPAYPGPNEPTGYPSKSQPWLKQ